MTPVVLKIFVAVECAFVFGIGTEMHLAENVPTMVPELIALAGGVGMLGCFVWAWFR